MGMELIFIVLLLLLYTDWLRRKRNKEQGIKPKRNKIWERIKWGILIVGILVIIILVIIGIYYALNYSY